MRKTVALGIFFFTVMFSVPSGGIDYFPTELGPKFNYSDCMVWISPQPENKVTRNRCAERLGGESFHETFQITESEDVLLLEDSFCCVGVTGFDGNYYEPGLMYLDFPLETGKSWTTSGKSIGIVNGIETDVVMACEVLGPKTVTVPAGEFDVIAVQMDTQFPLVPWKDESVELWFHLLGAGQ